MNVITDCVHPFMTVCCNAEVPKFSAFDPQMLPEGTPPYWLSVKAFQQNQLTIGLILQAVFITILINLCFYICKHITNIFFVLFL